MSKYSTNLLTLLRGIWGYLTPKRHFQLFGVLGLMILSAAAEVISLAAVIPFLNSLNQEINVEDLNYLNILTKILPILADLDARIITTFIFILFVFLASLVKLINLKVNCQIAAKIGLDLSYKLYSQILYQPYEAHLVKNTSEIIAVSVTQINQTVYCLNQVLLLLTSGISIFAITFALLFISWQLALISSLTFLSTYISLAIYSRKRLQAITVIVDESIKKQVQILQEGLGSIRDIILDSNQSNFLKSYLKVEKLSRTKQAEGQFLGTFPKYLIEGFALIIISSLSLYFTLSNNEVSIIPLLGTIAIASQRMLPAFQQCYAGWAGIKSRGAAIKSVLNLLNQPKEYERKISNLDKLRLINFDEITLKNISYKYPSAEDFTINDFNFTINKGDRVGIIGTTGTGKSTLVDIIMGLLEPTMGQIFVDKKAIHKGKDPFFMMSWRKSIAHVPQDIFLLDSSIAQNIAISSSEKFIDNKLVKDAAKKAKISKYIEGLPNKYKTIVGERGINLSGGQKQRIGIARAFYKNSSILILDEATSALDNATEKDVIDSISSLGKDITVIIIAHRLSTISECNKVIDLDKFSKS